MKTITAILLAMLCTACIKWPDPEASKPKVRGVYVYKDKETGCEYVSESRGLTPRMDANGKQICRKEQP